MSPDRLPSPPSSSTFPPLSSRQPPLDRPALERVLARAAELQAREADPADAMLTEEQLLEVGKEVGLAPHHIRQALAEERTRVAIPQESGSVAALFGPALVHASRTVRGTPESVFSLLDAWMQREEYLIVKRRFSDRILWEPRHGVFTELMRAFNVGGRGYHLARTEEVAATAFAIDSERTLVRLEANLGTLRTQRVVGAGMAAGSGVTATGLALALGFFAPIAAIPTALGLLGAFAVARSHTPVVARTQLVLEQVLDRLERGEMPRPSLLGALATGGRMGR